MGNGDGYFHDDREAASYQDHNWNDVQVKNNNHLPQSYDNGDARHYDDDRQYAVPPGEERQGMWSFNFAGNQFVKVSLNCYR